MSATQKRPFRKRRIRESEAAFFRAFGRVIDNERRRRGLPIEKLAAISEVSAHCAQNLIHGRHDPRGTTMLRLCSGLGRRLRLSFVPELSEDAERCADVEEAR